MVAEEHRWDLTALFDSFEQWQTEYAVCKQQSEQNSWQHLQKYRGRLASPQQLAELLKSYFETSRALERLYTYAHLRNDEDIAAEEPKKAYQILLNDLHDFYRSMAWMEPELLALSDEECQKLLLSPLLSEYRFYLEKIFHLRPHTLSIEGEELLARANKALQAPSKGYSALHNADFKFGQVKDGEGKSHTLTHGSYGLMLRSPDRFLRKAAFEAMHSQYRAYENTIAELLQGAVQSHVFNAQARHYKSALQAALYPNNIDVEVYHNLIKAVHDHLPVLHEYMKLRKEVLQVDQLQPYDLYLPLVADVDIRMNYDEARQIVIDSVKPLGDEYGDFLRKGLHEERWVDRFENKNKRSGAYSSGCYQSPPYILMNYKNLLRDVSTLAHEAGHSMHSLLSNITQLYHDSRYPIFLAEIASTFNEQLLMEQLLERYTSKQQQAFLLTEKIEEMRTTIFRQTLFAEFELFIHESVEQNIPLTPALMRDKYMELNRLYYGQELIVDELLGTEWARIPHFYYNFYVYQYATGLSAAIACYRSVREGGKEELDRYLQLLRSGGSDYPLNLLEKAGIDMRSGKPVASALESFGSLLRDLRALLPQIAV